MKNDNRFSPASFAERMIRGTDSLVDNFRKASKELLDPIITPDGLESERYAKEIKAIRELHKSKALQIILGGSEEVVMGAQKITSASTRAIGATVMAPFSLLGPTQNHFEYQITKSGDHETFRSWGGAVLSKSFQTFIGYGGKDNPNNFKTGISTLAPWGFGSAKKITKELLTLRPIKAANAAVESAKNLGSIFANTAISTIGTGQEVVFGFKNVLKNKLKVKQQAQQEQASQPISETRRQAPNPFDTFNGSSAA